MNGVHDAQCVMPSFIAFEGAAGTGKTTQVQLLRDYIGRHGHDVVITKAYEDDRKNAAYAFMESLSIPTDSIAMMFLFQTLHALQYTDTVRALSEKKIVIADRWRESFWAYHRHFGPLAHMPRTFLDACDVLAFADLHPSRTFVLNLPEELALERFLARDRQNNLCPTPDRISFFRITRQHYRDVAKERRWTIIDAQGSREEVHKSIVQRLYTH